MNRPNAKISVTFWKVLSMLQRIRYRSNRSAAGVLVRFEQIREDREGFVRGAFDGDPADVAAEFLLRLAGPPPLLNHRTMGRVHSRDGGAFRVRLERQGPSVPDHEMALVPGKLGKVLQGTEQTISDHELRRTGSALQSGQEMGDELGLVGFAIEIGGHIENQSIAGSVRDEQFAAQKFARCAPRFDQSLGHLLETLAIEDEDLERIAGGRNAVSDHRGEKGREAVGDLAKEGFAQTRGDATKFPVEGFIAGLVRLSVASQVGLSPRAFMFDEGFEDPGDELGKGNGVFVASSPVSLEEVSENGVGNAIGEEGERGLGQWQTLIDLAGELGGGLGLGTRCPQMGWQNHWGIPAGIADAAPRSVRRP